MSGCDCKKAIIPPQMICVDEFIPEVNVVLPDAPEQLIRRYVVDGSIVFAQETQFFLRDYKFFPQAALRRYYIETGEHEQVYKLIRACYDGMDYQPDREGVGYPFCYAYGGEWRFIPPGLFEVSDPPTCEDGECVMITYAAMPKRGATHVDRQFYERFMPAITAYAISKIGMTQGDTKNPYPFFSPNLAREYERQFKKELAAAKTDVMGAHVAGSRQLGSRAMRVI